MKFWVGITDNRWYNYLALRSAAEVNFWQPSARRPFTNLPEGTPFLFKLKAPYNHIAGGGFFTRFTTMPLATAWNAFGTENGAESLQAFGRLIETNATTPAGSNPEIGCSILTNVFYLPRERWINMSAVLPRTGIMQGKTFDTDVREHADVWNQVLEGLRDSALAETTALYTAPRFGRPFLTSARLGQGAFRTLVADAYERRCAVTGETTLPVLEAAHIVAYKAGGPHAVSNGMLMRADFHKLFDLNLVTVTPDYKIRVSKRIRDQWFNGKHYYALDGRELAILPNHPDDRPSPKFLGWHNHHFDG